MKSLLKCTRVVFACVQKGDNYVWDDPDPWWLAKAKTIGPWETLIVNASLVQGKCCPVLNRWGQIFKGAQKVGYWTALKNWLWVSQLELLCAEHLEIWPHMLKLSSLFISLPDHHPDSIGFFLIEGIKNMVMETRFPRSLSVLFFPPARPWNYGLA